MLVNLTKKYISKNAENVREQHYFNLAGHININVKRTHKHSI